MKNTFGSSVSITVFGESHGPYIGAVLDGLASGISISEEDIRHALLLRRPFGKISTARKESDDFIIASGVFNGKTTGTPITVIIPNSDTRSRDYKYGLARPSHADYTAFCKYHGNEDYRGGGHFSGRVTAGLVALGAIARTALANKNIQIGTHIKKLGGVCDKGFDFSSRPALEKDINTLWQRAFPTLSEPLGEEMIKKIEEVAAEGDSIGGLLETVVSGLPTGVGEPFFDSVESRISHAIFSIPAVKGVMFGAGESFLEMKGSEANDAMRLSEDKRVITETNHNGGVLGGITNGEPLVFSTVVKPTPSISRPQRTVNFLEKSEEMLEITGRHDPCIAHRARAVVDALTAVVLCDMLAERFGTDWLAE